MNAYRYRAAAQALPAPFLHSTVLDAIRPPIALPLFTAFVLGPQRGEQSRKRYELGKRCLDIILALAVLLLSSPFLIILPLLIRWSSPGRSIFRQERVGQNGEVFTMYKFRTMHASAPGYGYSPTGSQDPRLTRIGRLLRRTSLDELPQLINVLAGKMSLVGPRPEMPFIVQDYTDEQRQRLSVKPGMTGLWQISPHRLLPIHEHLEYDFYYLRHRSFRLDAAILLQTLLVAGRGV